MKNYRLHISEGFRDSFGPEMLVKKEIESRTLKAFSSFGYELIKTPAVEYIDVYSDNGIQKPDVYNLINRQGEVMALCNDMTASIARFVGSNPVSGPVKYCYCADVLRYPKPYQGKQHQFLQAGVEYIGGTGLEVDAECIYLAFKCLTACNVKGFTIHLGSAKFLELLLEDFGIAEELRKQVYRSIENKDYVSLKKVLIQNIEKEKADFILELMLRGGKLRYIERLMKQLTGTKSYEILKELKQIYMTLRELEVDNLIFDFSIYSYAKYYTGIIFSVYADGIAKAVIEGGRCDTILQQFGKSLPDIGFGLDIDSLTTYALKKNSIEIRQEKYLSFCHADSFVPACRKNELLRKSGVIVNHLPFPTLEEARQYARRHGYCKIIEYEENSFKLWEVEEC